MTSSAVEGQLTSTELAAIGALLESNGVRLDGPLAADRIAGGRSNLTFRLTDGHRRWVLRTPPRTGRTPSAHDVAREYRVVEALKRTAVPVPPAVLLCEEESLLGGPFAICEFVGGVTVQTRHQLDTLDDAAISAVASALVSTLADLHRVDHGAIGLASFGRPDAYAARQLRRWSGQWLMVGAADHEGLAARLIHQLEAALPEQRASSIVHGDFRIDNTILDLHGHTATSSATRQATSGVRSARIELPSRQLLSASATA